MAVILADDIFIWIFLNENDRIRIEISLKFVPRSPIDNKPALVQVMAWRRPCDKPLFEPMMVIIPTHICVMRPQWLNNFTSHPISMHLIRSNWNWSVLSLSFRVTSLTSGNWPNSQIPEFTCSISHNAPFRTEMCTFVFWMEHRGIWNRCILGFVKLVNCNA